MSRQPLADVVRNAYFHLTKDHDLVFDFHVRYGVPLGSDDPQLAVEVANAVVERKESCAACRLYAGIEVEL